MSIIRSYRPAVITTLVPPRDGDHPLAPVMRTFITVRFGGQPPPFDRAVPYGATAEQLPEALALDDDLVAGVSEPVECAVAEDGIVEEAQPLVDGPVGGDYEAGPAMPCDYQLVEVDGLLLGHPVETEVVEDEQVWG